MQETTIVGMIPMQETTNIVANVKDCRTFQLSLPQIIKVQENLNKSKQSWLARPKFLILKS